MRMNKWNERIYGSNIEFSPENADILTIEDSSIAEVNWYDEFAIPPFTPRELERYETTEARGKWPQHCNCNYNNNKRKNDYDIPF